jgi:hypothetical protein
VYGRTTATPASSSPTWNGWSKQQQDEIAELAAQLARYENGDLEPPPKAPPHPQIF